MAKDGATVEPVIIGGRATRAQERACERKTASSSLQAPALPGHGERSAGARLRQRARVQTSYSTYSGMPHWCSGAVGQCEKKKRTKQAPALHHCGRAAAPAADLSAACSLRDIPTI